MAEFQHECEELGEEINEGIEALEEGVDAVQDAAETVQNGVAAAKAAKTKVMKAVKKSDAAYQKDITNMEAEAKEAVKGEVEDALEEGVEAMKEMLDEMEDDLVPPLDMVVPLLTNTLSQCAPKFIQQCWRGLERGLANAPALLHLVAIEFLPMWFFMFSVRSVFKGAIVEGLTLGEDGVNQENWMKKMLNKDGVNAQPALQKKLDECSARQVSMQIDFRQCADRFNCAENLDDSCEFNGRDVLIMSVVWGAYLLVFAMMLFVVISFCCRGLMCKRLTNSSYLKFCLDIKRSVIYRYLSGTLYVCAVLSLLGIFALVITQNLLDWFIQEELLALVITALSMRAFTRPFKPKFSTLDAAEGSSFSDLLFRRQFFEGSGGFSSRLSSALLQASRMPRAPVLRKMLCVAPENEREMARQVRLVKQVCQRPSQPGKAAAPPAGP